MAFSFFGYRAIPFSGIALFLTGRRKGAERRPAFGVRPWLRAKWDTETPSNTRVELYTRAGNELEEIPHYYDRAGNEISEEEWKARIK